MKCKISQTHKRLNEVHRLWHQTARDYYNPDGFRTNLNATIQAMRNLTFALQNEKKAIDNFDEWYLGWQNRMKQSQIMRWVCDARTDIVHKKDLELYSKATVKINSYIPIQKIEIEIPIWISGKKLLKYLLGENVIDETWQNLEAYAVVQRKWSVSEFPEEDVLCILAQGIEILTELVIDAHKITNTDIYQCSVIDSLHKLEIGENGTPKCMSLQAITKNDIIDLKNFISRQITCQRVDWDDKTFKKVRSKYRGIFREGKGIFSTNPYEFAENVSEMAKRLIVKDGYHASILWYRTTGEQWKMMQAIFEDQASKYIFWQEFAQQVKKENIDAIIFVSETWIGTFDKLLESGQRASQQEDRKEALIVEVFVKEQQAFSHITMFERNFLGRVVLKETKREELDLSLVGYMQPVLEVWKTER